jgi:uncharacterized membrane protein YeiH
MDITTDQLLYIAGLVGVGVFAVSGALAAAEKNLDILGFILFATVTGVGGGTLRDLILGVDVFWVAHPLDLQICVAAGVLTYFIATQFLERRRLQRVLLWADAMGLALFCVLGTAKAYSIGVDPLVACAMGMMTPTFGSVIRDILSGREPVLLGPEIYVTAALAGALSYLVLTHWISSENITLLAAMLIAFSVRASALLFDLRLPKFSKR